MQNYHKFLWGIIIIPWFLSRVNCFDGAIHEAGFKCGSYEYPGDGGGNKLKQNLMIVMDAVSFQVKEHGWGAQTLVGNWHPMYALGQCHRDLNPTQCYTCFTQARQLLSRCVPKVSGRIYLDGCFLRYDNYTFFDESVDYTRDTNMCGSIEKGETVLAKSVASVILNVSKSAGEHRFAVDGEGGVFALAQCWETVDKWSCQRCLKEAGKKVQGCVPSVEGRSLFTGCFLRYSTRKFYNDVVAHNDTWASIPPPPPPERHNNVWIIFACVISAIAVILLIVPSVFLSRRRIASHDKTNNHFGASPSFAYVAGFSFRYDVLEKGTHYFDPANKLGLHAEGDGSVFKGTLPSGRTVAVKRLFFDTRQWTDVLFNEVNLINGIQHKNVVKLLGCSIDGPESLLVYEFLPNKSLDQILFGEHSKNVLSWEQRFQIICGIAEGLAYLHEGSGTKIIHRDIKSNNILLDEALNPKIVDFGLAFCVPENKSHLNTTAGTLGYMAPECVSKGQLTEKADIYAFGVMVTEIVCGKKNSAYPQGSNSILHCVWKNYKANNITTSIDPALHGKFMVEEASNVLQVALLCTQSSPTLRPSMSEIVQMLTKKDYIIPSPKQQPFLNYTMLTLDDRTLASTTSIMSNGHASTRSSFHSTTSSLPPGEDTTLLENPFSSSAKFNISESPDSNIQVNIVVPHPR